MSLYCFLTLVCSLDTTDGSWVKGFRSSGERQERNRGVAAIWASSSSSSKIAAYPYRGVAATWASSSSSSKIAAILTEGERLPGLPPALQVR